MELVGVVCSGLAEAALFMRQPRYNQMLWLRLGRPVYPGTLNVLLDGDNLELWKKLKEKPHSRIREFTAEGKTFGGILLWQAKIGEHDVLIICPEKSRHAEDVVELVAGHPLKARLGLKDGDEIRITVLE